MAVFADYLAYSLFLLSFAGFLILYLVTSVYLVYRRKQMDYYEHMSGAFAPFLLVGVYMILQSMYGQFTLLLTAGSGNIVFYGPLVSFGLILVALAISIRYKLRYEYVGFLGLLIGLMAIAYGLEGYGTGMATGQVGILALYFLYGLAGMASYPVSLVIERLPGLQKNPWLGWILSVAVFWLALFAASLLAGYLGATTIGGQPASVP